MNDICNLSVLLNTWLKANKLSLNVNKTYYFVFHRARIKVDNNTSIRMNDGIINSASHLNYLGVIIDRITHITYVKNKVSKGIRIMFKARDYLNKNVCQTCTVHIYFHISFIVLKCGVIPPIVTYIPCFNTEKNYSVNHIIETFSSYRTYVQILNYSSTQQSLLLQNWTFN